MQKNLGTGCLSHNNKRQAMSEGFGWPKNSDIKARATLPKRIYIKIITTTALIKFSVQI